MNIKKLSFMLLSAMSLALLLNGCGSSNRESAVSAGNVARVGDTACFQCHAATTDSLTGETFIEQYKRSLHAELGCESCHGGGAQHNGVGPFPYELNSEVSDAQKAARCAQCHDGVTQVTKLNGEVVVAPLSSSPNFQNGNHANPFSAEEAHEAKCARCHSHEGSILYGKEGYTGDKSIINNTAYQPVLARDPETFNTIKCATCHEHGGNIRQTKTRDLAGNVVTWDPDGNKVISQFDICTSCHTMNTNEGKQIGSGNTLSIANTAGGFTNVSTAAFYHDTAWFRTLPSTHYDQPASGTTAGGTVIEGYVIRKNQKNPCYECHGHEFKANTRAYFDKPERGSTIFTDWAQSGHAGKLLTQKIAASQANGGTTRSKGQVDAVMKAGATDATGPAWTHYDWDASNRASCQRCHTSTGASNFMTNPATYNAADNRFTHLAGWSRTSAGVVTSSGQNELLYCWGCHSNAGTGTLRSPGAITETYSPATAGDPATTVAYPNIGKSNVCMTCHLGREIGDVIKNDQDADGIRSFVNSHYLTAGGTVFGKTGYTLGGRDYDSTPKGFVHDKLGVSPTGEAAADAYIAGNGLSTSGPCATCHLTSQKLGVKTSHSYSPFSVYSTTIKNTALNPVCVTCHPLRGDGSNAKQTWFEDTWKLRSDAALEALRVQLNARGMYFSNAYPYFFAGPGGTGGSFTNWAGVFAGGFAEWKDAMGVAFNYNVLAHDPGAVAHNRYYVRRLIYDSIDKLDNGVLDYSVFATLNALDETVATYKTNAITFLINRGTADVNVGTAAERF